MYFKKWKDFLIVSEEVTNNSNTNGTNANNTENKTSVSGTNSNIENNNKFNDKDLQAELQKWNSQYSQNFKFNHDMPKAVKNENTVEELLLNIPDEYKSSVKEGITKFVNYLQNEKFANSINNKELSIIGYTSTTGSDTYNQSLSLRRAKIVANAIKNLIKISNIKVNIILKEEGMGENIDGLIIINDQSLEPVQLGKNATPLSDDVKKLIEKSKEERQKINRRVKITLPQFKFEEPIIKPNIVKPTEEIKKEIVEKPSVPEPKSITFNLNSFILKKEGQAILSTFTEKLKQWNDTNKEDNKKIKNIYISAHTILGKGDNQNIQKDIETAKKSTTIIAANRAQLVKDYIKYKLGEDSVKNIKFYCYPVAFKMGSDEKKVVINFEETEHMKTAKKEFESLASEYNLPKDNFGLQNLPLYLKNEPLYSGLEKNIKATINDEKDEQFVPIELWYDNLEGYYGLKKYTDERNNFKSKFEKIISEENKKKNKDYTLEEFVYKPE